MKHPFSTLVRLLIAWALLALLIGCASVSPPSTALACPKVPPLSPLALPPPPPPICVPTCSAGLMRLRDSLLPMPTASGPLRTTQSASMPAP